MFRRRSEVISEKLRYEVEKELSKALKINIEKYLKAEGLIIKRLENRRG